MPTSITSSGITFDDATTQTTSATKAGGIGTTQLANASVTPAKLSQPYTLDTAKASTSGTSIDFTGIPSWAKKVIVMLDGVSTSGTSNLLLRLGTSSGPVTSGYSSWCLEGTNGTVVTTNTSTAGILLTQDNGAADTTRAVVTVVNLTANTWLATGTGLNGSWGTVYSASVGLGGTLDRIRITTVNGTDAFDAGSINIAYEG